MAVVVVTGGGLIGLSTAMLLARDGHDVTVFERDAAAPPDPGRAWDDWDRRGVNQFRMGHFLLARSRAELSRELPDVVDALAKAGALDVNLIGQIPDTMTGGFQPGDERYSVLTGRRPVVEAVVAGVAAETPRVAVRRGAAVTGLLTGSSAASGVPHVVGVRTDDEEVRADLVVDATGRRSPLPQWLAAVGAEAPEETVEDSGFVYYGRHFASPTGIPPVLLGPALQHFGSYSILHLAADNATWSVVLVTSARDKALRALRDPETWAAVVRSLPLSAHWLDGVPLEDEVAVIAKIEDRRRRFAPDGRPTATGVVAVGDSWACTNPSLGRGISIGLVHAVALRDHVAAAPLDDPGAFAVGWAERTEEVVEPWFSMTRHFDRHRLAEIDADVAGVPYEPGDDRWEMERALPVAAQRDPELLRPWLDATMVYRTTDEIFADDAVAQKVRDLGSGWRDEPQPGPTRDELLAVVAG